MSTTEPTPIPDAATVVADVHTALDTAKTDVQAAVDAVEHIDLGHLADEVKQLVHDGIELIKQRVHDLFHGGSAVAQSAPDSTPTV